VSNVETRPVSFRAFSVSLVSINPPVLHNHIHSPSTDLTQTYQLTTSLNKTLPSLSQPPSPLVTKIRFEDTDSESVEWINTAQDRDQQYTLVHMVMNIRVA
jgi:hypothetical protein